MSWAKIVPKGAAPSERNSTSLVATGNVAYLFGGTHDRDAYNDVWELDVAGSTWKKIEATGDIPPARWGHSASLIGKKIFVFGGEIVGGKSNSMHVFDIESKKWSTPANISGATPNPRSYHAVTSADNKIYLFGGDGGDNSMYVFDTTTSVWSKLATSGYPPQSRKKHSIALFGRDLLVFGGVDLNNMQYLSDMFVLNLDSLAWTQQQMKGPIADARGGHTSCVINGKFFVWGGNSQKAYFNELHYVDPTDNYLWFKKKGMGAVPAARTGHSAALLGDKWLIFGGNINDKTPTNDTAIMTPSGIY